MTSATLDRLLGALIAATAVTGALTLRAGDPSSGLVYVAHAIASWALAGAVGVKLATSLPRAIRARRWGRLAVAALVVAVSLASLLGGIAWATSGRIVSLSGWTLITLHALAGIALIPILAVHLLPRRWRLLVPASAPSRPLAPGRRLISRRSVVAMGALGLVGVAGWGLGNTLDALRGSPRRFTGSRYLPPGGIPAPTTFLGDTPPHIDLAAWRLQVHGLVDAPATYSLAELQALGYERVTAVLDCTSGWALETEWAGVPLASVLELLRPSPLARWVEVRSATGWGTGLRLDEAAATLLATHVAGEPLPVGNGAPCRLVIPSRRGLDWVKWVTEIEVT